MKLPLRLGYFEGIAADNGMGREVWIRYHFQAVVYSANLVFYVPTSTISKEKSYATGSVLCPLVSLASLVHALVAALI